MMRSRIFLMLAPCLWLSNGMAQDSSTSIQQKSAAATQVDRVVSELEILKGIIEQESTLGSEAESLRVEFALESDSVGATVTSGVSQKEAELLEDLSERISEDVGFWHSSLSFAVEDFLGSRADLKAMQYWIRVQRGLVEQYELPLAPDVLSMLALLEESLAAFERAKGAFSSEPLYYAGADQSLIDELSNLAPSMRAAGKKAIAMLSMAPQYRELACEQLGSMEGEPVESLMAYWIYDGQFQQRAERKSTYADFLNPGFVRGTLTDFPEFYLNEERLKIYTWLNEAIIRIMFEEMQKEQLCNP